jgi:hypothetical protein
MHATFACPQCRAARPIRFDPLLAGESSLGTRIGCAHCGRYAFTLIRPARFYCEICDDVQPGVLEPADMECAPLAERDADALGVLPDALGVLFVCAGCFDGKALLYAAATPNRCAGAAASAPTAPGFRADRARRG